MKIKITGKELKITEAINDYVERKMERIDKYFEEAEAEVTLKTEKNEQIAEIYVTANGEKYRAVTEDKDMYASIDKDIDILEGQIRKAKTKREKMMKDASLKTMETVMENLWFWWYTREENMESIIYYDIGLNLFCKQFSESEKK